MDIDDGFLHLLLPDGSTKEDVKLPEDALGKQIKEGFDDGKELMVTIVAAMGEEAAVSFKEAVRISLRHRSIDSCIYPSAQQVLSVSPGQSSISSFCPRASSYPVLHASGCRRRTKTSLFPILPCSFMM